jgi:hypothetical protein
VTNHPLPNLHEVLLDVHEVAHPVSGGQSVGRGLTSSTLLNAGHICKGERFASRGSTYYMCHNTAIRGYAKVSKSMAKEHRTNLSHCPTYASTSALVHFLVVICHPRVVYMLLTGVPYCNSIWTAPIATSFYFDSKGLQFEASVRTVIKFSG